MEKDKIINLYGHIDNILIQNKLNEESYEYVIKLFNENLKDFLENLAIIKRKTNISNSEYFVILEYLEKFNYLLSGLIKLKIYDKNTIFFQELSNEISNILKKQEKNIQFFISTVNDLEFIKKEEKLLNTLNDIQNNIQDLISENTKNKKNNSDVCGNYFCNKLIGDFLKFKNLKIKKILKIAFALFLVYVLSDVFANIIHNFFLFLIGKS